MRHVTVSYLICVLLLCKLKAPWRCHILCCNVTCNLEIVGLIPDWPTNITKQFFEWDNKSRSRVWVELYCFIIWGNRNTNYTNNVCKLQIELLKTFWNNLQKRSPSIELFESLNHSSTDVNTTRRYSFKKTINNIAQSYVTELTTLQNI
jgi:hypothetical protein